MDRPVLVETGSFRVDPARALEKLKRWQLPDAASATLLWVRCAVAGGAGRVDIRQRRGYLEIGFDGKPFTRKSLEWPFAPLLSPDDEDPRRRYAAAALLRLLRSGPKSLELISGQGAERRTLFLRSIADREVFRSDDAVFAANVVRARWGFWRGGRCAAFRPDARLIRRSCSMCPAIVAVNGKTLWEPAHAVESGFPIKGPRMSGTLDFPGGTGRTSTILAYLHGVFAGKIRGYGKLPLGVTAKLDSPDWPLNVSMTGVVKNKEFDKAVLRVAPHLGRFLESVAGSHGKLMAEEGPRLMKDPRLRKVLRNGHLMRREDAGRPDGRFFASVEHARRTLWLRRACRVLRTALDRPGRKEAPFGPGALGALWRAPLFWDVRGIPLSPEELDRTARGGLLRWSEECMPDYDESARVVWCVWGRIDQRWLRRVFAVPLRRVRPGKAG